MRSTKPAAGRSVVSTAAATLLLLALGSSPALAFQDATSASLGMTVQVLRGGGLGAHSLQTVTDRPGGEARLRLAIEGFDSPVWVEVQAPDQPCGEFLVHTSSSARHLDLSYALGPDAARALAVTVRLTPLLGD